MNSNEQKPQRDPFWTMFLACLMAIAFVDIMKRLGFWL